VAPEAGLRLRAEDAADLAVISACLQDALVPVCDLAFDRDERRFLMIANRFRWEAGQNGVAGFERTLCGIAFEDVDGVSYRGFRRNDEERILSLLAIRTQDAGRIIDLDFSAGASIRLSVGTIRCRVRDLGEPWPTAWQPGHETDRPA